jgi:hypothetical protein
MAWRRAREAARAAGIDILGLLTAMRLETVDVPCAAISVLHSAVSPPQPQPQSFFSDTELEFDTGFTAAPALALAMSALRVRSLLCKLALPREDIAWRRASEAVRLLLDGE